MRLPDDAQEQLGVGASQSSRDCSADEKLLELEPKIRQRLQELEELRQLPLDNDVEMIIGIPSLYE